jgi:hypothetical protein
MQLLDRLHRWWKPAQWQDDHPLSADERLAEELHESHRWNEAQNVGGPNSWGRVDPNRDLRSRSREPARG